ncbi:hypothetical protein [Solitalea koreensis]|uniref:Outer membrane efflux protein n=1 Tax=Solitalea koreensis TaxID=543615 RepID=A0A521DKY5_9SPHI|nr:hypothetical protein [Solitalea koreensis]SMO72369.1 hypothetical protein SAMN06265350_107110 [Solitalea koreensis]
MKKKLLGILLLSCICIMQTKAQNQIKDDVIENNLSNILTLKLQYEEARTKMLDSRLTNYMQVNACKAAHASYVSAVRAIQRASVRQNYLSYLNKTIKEADQSHINSTIRYSTNPSTSNNDKVITNLDYLKLVRYCLFIQKKGTLSEVTSIPPSVRL